MHHTHTIVRVHVSRPSTSTSLTDDTSERGAGAPHVDIPHSPRGSACHRHYSSQCQGVQHRKWRVECSPVGRWHPSARSWIERDLITHSNDASDVSQHQHQKEVRHNTRGTNISSRDKSLGTRHSGCQCSQVAVMREMRTLETYDLWRTTTATKLGRAPGAVGLQVET